MSLPDRIRESISDKLGIPIIRSALLPPGTMIIGDFSAARLWDDDGSWSARDAIRWHTAIDWPANPRRLALDHPLADVVKLERAKAFGHLEQRLDGMCRDLGLDPETVWRGPRVREDTQRTNRLHIAAETRLAMSIIRPEHHIVFSSVV